MDLSTRSAKVLRFELLGTPAWFTDDRSGTLSSKSAPLVAYLALNGRQPRDTLAQLFWPGDKMKANDSLRKHEQRLRAATGHDTLLHGDAVELAGGVACDVDERLEDWATSRLLACGEFLAGVELAELTVFSTWMRVQREHWRGLVGDELTARSLALEADGRVGEALKLVERASTLAPWLERAWRQQMRLHFRRGDNAAALKAFARVEGHLRALRGALPSGETLALRDEIEGSVSAAPQRADCVQSSLLRPPKLIGRDRQWSAMDRAWLAGRPFLLRGEAGIGKSRLLGDYLRDKAVAVLACARPGDEQAPYATLAALLRLVIDTQGLEPQGFTRRELSRVMPELDESPPSTPADQLSLWRAAETLLLSAADAGVQALAIDDLQFADLATLDALRWLAAGSAREVLRFAFAARPFKPGARRSLVEDWLTDSQRPEPVDLWPFDPQELDELLVSLNLTGEPAALTSERLLAHTGGQPFLVLETLRTLAHAADGNGLPTPAAVRPLLERRLRRAPLHTRPLQQMCAVMGADATLERAMQGLGCTPSSIAQWADELELHGTFQQGRFAHDMLRETVLGLMSRTELMQRHAQAAGVLASDVRIPHARVGVHWETAEQWPQAAACFRAAGREARAVGRLAESRELLERAAVNCRRAGDLEGQFDALFDVLAAALNRCEPAGAQAATAADASTTRKVHGAPAWTPAAAASSAWRCATCQGTPGRAS